MEKMEADSTTYDNLQNYVNGSLTFPFPVSESNQSYYTKNIQGELSCALLVQRLQSIGIIPSSMSCPSKREDCHMTCVRANNRDRIKWACKACNTKMLIRTGTIFFKLNCSMLQVLQLTMAWCEDVDLAAAASYFDIEPATANKIVLKLNEVASEALIGQRLGGPNSVVLTEMYPQCTSNLTPDSTMSHSHHTLMMADTNHIPTRYHLHVIKNPYMQSRTVMTPTVRQQITRDEVTQIISNVSAPGTLLVRGQHVDAHVGTSLATLMDNADHKMQQFLTNRIWQQSVTLCSAAQDLCNKDYPPLLCARVMQRYLSASLFRLQHADALFEAILKAIAKAQ